MTFVLIELTAIHSNTWNHLTMCKQILVSNKIISAIYQHLKSFNCLETIAILELKHFYHILK